MAFGRMRHMDASNLTPGLCYIEYSAILQGTGTVTSARGTEGVASLVYAGSTGTYTLTLRDGGVRYVVSRWVDLEANGGGDGAYATMTAPTQGEGSTLPLVWTVFTHAAGGALTNYTGRRIFFDICIELSAAGK